MRENIDDLAQDCGYSAANTLELSQSCTRPWILHLSLELEDIYGLVQDCGNSIDNKLELPQSCTKSLI